MARGGLVFSTLAVRCSDGRVVDLINPTNGILLKEWKPTIPPAKGGGIYSDSTLADGRRLNVRKLDNAIETLNLTVRDSTQDEVIEDVNVLIDLLETAVAFWTTKAAQTPVWLEARGPFEGGMRYALIKNYQLSELGNPFAAPFFGPGCNYAMDDLTLVIERGDWLATVPEQPECIEVNSTTEAASVIERGYPLASADDCYVTGATIGLATNMMGVGYTAGASWHMGIRFNNIDIPQGSTILSAELRLMFYGSTIKANLFRIWIYAHDVDSSTVFSTAADYNGRAVTSARKWWSFVGPNYVNDNITTPDFANVIQEVIDRAGWVANNELSLLIKDAGGSNSAALFYTWDYYNVDPATRATARPMLTIKYANARGITETCERGAAFVTNKFSTASIETILRYDASGPTYTNITTTATPVNLMPATIAVGDIIYFGSTNPFTNVIFDITTEISGGTATGEYEYSQGAAAWGAFVPPGELLDNTSTGAADPFTLTGINKWEWAVQSDWATDTVSGYAGLYWVRFRVTGITGTPASPQQGNRFMYTCTWPSVKVLATHVSGTMPALANIYLEGQSGYTTGSSAPGSMDSRAYIIVTPDSRLASYSPFINLSDEQTTPGQSGITLGARSTYANNLSAATGRVIQYAPGGVPRTDDIIGNIDLTVDGYFGRYHVFLRARPATTATASEFGIYLRSLVTPASYETYYQTPIVYNKSTSAAFSEFWEVYDLGVVPIPASSDRDRYSQLIPGSTVRLNLYVNAATGGDNLYLHDLVLIPVFENVAFAHTPHADFGGLPEPISLYQFTTLAVESAADLRSTVKAVIRNVDTDETHGEWDRSVAGPMLLHNGVDQHVSIFTMRNTQGSTIVSSNPHTMFTMRVTGTRRYFGMRGDR